MEKVDIYKYINSKDIREHLKNINYKFTMFEAMCIVNDAYQTPLIERLNAYKNIRFTFDNCEFVEPDGSKWVNISKTIGNYIDSLNEFITSLYLEHGYIFSYEYIDYNDKYNNVHSDKMLFKDFANILDYLKENTIKKLLLWIYRYKSVRDLNDGIRDVIHINNDYEISNVIERRTTETSITSNPFDASNINVPIPFKRGDKLWDSNCPTNSEGKLLVYEFVEKVDEGIKVLWGGKEKIETNYLSMEYYK